MSTGCTSSHNGFLDVSRSNGGLRISGWIGQLLSAELWHVANSKIRTKPVDKTLKIFINESKSVKIHEKSRISRKQAYFTEEGQFHGTCHGREIVN